jgi:hypothetical protein
MFKHRRNPKIGNDTSKSLQRGASAGFYKPITKTVTKEIQPCISASSLSVTHFVHEG